MALNVGTTAITKVYVGTTEVRKGYVGTTEVWSASTPWTPAQLTTALWLDASDSSTITLNGSNVSQWNDKSGNSRHYAQGVAANQPAYSATAYNSKPGITFDGSTDVLARSTTGTSATTLTAAFVVSPTNTTYGFYYLLDFETGRIIFATDAGVSDMQPAMFINGAYAGPTGSAVTAQSILVYRTESTTGGIWRDGTRIYTLGTGASVAINGNSAVGARHTTFASPYQGIITEIVVCPSSLSDANRERLEGYLAWKWGNESLLPAGHTYKAGAPTL